MSNTPCSVLFRYSDRYCSGAFLLSEVTGWRSSGESYYWRCIITLRNGQRHTLDWQQYKEFEQEYEKWQASPAAFSTSIVQPPS